MGVKVSAREAARLSGRTERTIRAWVASGKLHAEPAGTREPGPGVGPTRWLIDVDALAQMPGVSLDRARLAELELRATEAALSTSLVERVAQLEQDVEQLKRTVADHERRHHRERDQLDR